MLIFKYERLQRVVGCETCLFNVIKVYENIQTKFNYLSIETETLLVAKNNKEFRTIRNITFKLRLSTDLTEARWNATVTKTDATRVNFERVAGNLVTILLIPWLEIGTKSGTVTRTIVIVSVDCRILSSFPRPFACTARSYFRRRSLVLSFRLKRAAGNAKGPCKIGKLLHTNFRQGLGALYVFLRAACAGTPLWSVFEFGFVWSARPKFDALKFVFVNWWVFPNSRRGSSVVVLDREKNIYIHNVRKTIFNEENSTNVTSKLI